MEKPIDLVAVDRVVGGVEVQHQFLWRLGVRRDEHLDQRLGDLGQGLARHPVLEPAQRRRRRQRLVGVDPPLGHQLHQRVVSKMLMIVAIFVPHRDGKDPLPEHRRLLMGDHLLVPRVGNRRVDPVD